MKKTTLSKEKLELLARFGIKQISDAERTNLLKDIFKDEYSDDIKNRNNHFEWYSEDAGFYSTKYLENTDINTLEMRIKHTIKANS